MKHDPIYKIDSKGKLRLWMIESDLDLGYRVISGLVDGKQAVTKFKEVTPKNVGRSNETSVAEQIALEVAAAYAKQVKTEGYHYDIADAGKGKSYFAPMLAESYKAWPVAEGQYVYSQPKFDGFRCLTYKDNIHSREGEAFLSVPHVERGMQPFIEANPSFVFDGELYNHEYHDAFHKIQKMLTRRVNLTQEHFDATAKDINYYVYDFYDRDRPNLTFEERRVILEEVLKDAPPHIRFVKSEMARDHQHLLYLYNELLEANYEGQMVRLPNSVYEPDGRSKGLLKHKPLFDVECVIKGYEEGTGNWKGAIKSLTVYLPELDITTDVSVTGTREDNAALFIEGETLLGTLVTVEHYGITKNRKFRFGQAVKFWRTTERLY